MPCQEQEAATPLCSKAPIHTLIAWPLMLSTNHCLHLLSRLTHSSTCKVFPTDVGTDVDAGIDGIRVLALADCLLLVRQFGRVFLGRKEGKTLGFVGVPFSHPNAEVCTLQGVSCPQDCRCQSQCSRDSSPRERKALVCSRGKATLGFVQFQGHWEHGSVPGSCQDCMC